MRSVSFDAAPVRERDDGGAIGRVRVRDYFGRGHQIEPGPQAYIGEQLEAGSELFAHFHDVDQFQVVVFGTGRFGRHRVAPVTVQYADAFSTYGPIVADDGGLGYFVLRRCAATGGWRMPEYAHLAEGAVGRRFFVAPTDLDRRPATGQAEREGLWGPADDGLEVAVLRLGANAQATPPPAGCGAQYLLVSAGALVQDGMALGVNAVLLQEADEPPESVTAGPEGAVLLVLRLPMSSQRRGSDPAHVQGRAGEYVRAVNSV